jgi:hypothetical protein
MDIAMTIFDYAWALVGALLMIIWSMLNSRITTNHKVLNDKIDAQAETFESKIADIKSEAEVQRASIDRLADKFDEHAKASVDRHIELLNTIHISIRKDH